MSIIKVVKHSPYINNSDILRKGEAMGYDWNTICDWLLDAEIYGQDGSGYSLIGRIELDKNGDPTDGSNKDLAKIINAILDEESLDKIMVIDD